MNQIGNYSDVGYVEASTYRKKVLTAVEGKPKTPTTIAKKSDIRANHISKVLSQLKNHGLVVCLNEEARKGRLYKLTERGDFVLKNLDI